MKRLIIILALLALLIPAFADTVQIGTGVTTTSYFPIHGLYNYSYSQQIFTQSQIGVSGEISKIRFYYASGSITSSYQWTIYMGHSTRTEFSTTTDWESPNNLTEVFSGDVTNFLPATNNWMEITLDSPFFYNNTENLIVAAMESSPAYTSMTWGAFTSGTNTGIYYSEDTNPINLSALPTAKGRAAAINRIQLVFPNSSEPLAPTLLEPANGSWALNDAMLRWTSTLGGSDANTYDVYFGTDSNPPLVSEDQVANFYEPTLEDGHTYYWKVVARNEIGDSPATDIYSFRTPGMDNLVESFEDTVFPPLGWANPGTWSRSTSYKVHGAASAYKAGTASAQYVLSTPRLTLTNDSNLSFWAYCNNNTAYLQVVYSPDGVNWTQVGDNITYPAASTWYNYSVDLSSLAGNDYYMGLRTGLQTGSHYVDLIIGPEITPELPNAATLVSPADNATLVSLTPTFTWNTATTGGIPSSYKVYCDIQNPPTTLVANLNALTYTLDTALDYDTTYYWQVVPWNSLGDADNCPVRSFTTIPEGLVSIGDGSVTTLNLPLNPYYGYNYSQNIYLQSEINVPDQRIEKIAYYWNGLNSGNNSRNWTIYMAHTDLGAFASTTSWIPISEFTQVFSGELAIPMAAGWIDITFTNPFIYNNSQNLVIAVLETTPGNDGSTTKFLGTNVLGVNRGLRIQSDTVVHNPASPGTGTLVTGIANILMQFGDLPSDPIFSYTPNALNFGEVIQNTPTNWQNVEVTNTGAGVIELSDTDISIIGLNDRMFEFDAVNLPFALSPGESGLIPVRFTATDEGDLSATLRMVYDGENYDVALSGRGLPAGTIFIGDGIANNYLPVNTLYGYSYAQTIYHQSDINMQGQRIEKISYYWNGLASGETSNLWTVYIGHTDLNDFATTTSWIPFSQLTQVFSGTLDIPASPGWIEVELQNPFVYNNIQNLVIAVDENQPSYVSAGFFFTTPTPSQYYSLRCQSDSVNPDPAAPPTGTRTAARPNIRMIFGDLPDFPVFTYGPEALDFGVVPQTAPTMWKNVMVTNAGGGLIELSASNISIFGRDADMFEYDAINLPFALGAGESGFIPVRITATDEGELSATLRIVYAGENYDVALYAEALPLGTVIIGDGTTAQRYPFGTLYGYERSASLYKAEELGLIGYLDSVAWDCAVTTATVVPYKIYAGLTNDDVLTAQTFTNLTQSLTLVKEGTYSFSTTGWHEFALDTPFAYTGGNLIVAVETNYGGSGGGSGHTFRYTTTNATGSHIYWQTDSNPPATTGTINALRPNLKLYLVEPAEGAPAAPIMIAPEHNATGIAASGFNLSWAADLENGGVPDYYAVFLSQDEDSIFDNYYFETENTFFDPVNEGGMEFGYEDTWYWLIMAVNDHGEALAERALAFTIEDDPRILSLPFSENFDSVSAGTIFPRAWTPVKTNASSSLTISSTYSQSPSNSVYMYNYTTTETMRLVTPEIAVPLNTIKLSFYLRATSATNYSMKIGTVDSPDASGSFTEIATITPTVAAVFEYYDVSFANYTGTDRYIAFQHGTNTTYQSFYLDTVLFEELMPNDMAAISIEAPGFGPAGTPFSFHVGVKNNGTEPQDSYQVQLKSADTVLVNLTVNETLAPDETAIHELVWIPTQGGNYQVFGEVVLAGDGNSANNTTDTKALLVFDSGMSMMDIGDDDTTLSGYFIPFNFYYKSSLSDIIYYHDELRMESGSINALILKNTFSSATVLDKHIKILMANTTAENITAGWLPGEDFVEVFDGNIDFPVGENSIVIPLHTPFAYTGGNLAVRYNRRLDTGYHSTSDKFFYTNTPEHANRARYMQSDTVEYNPLDPAASAVGTVLSYVPNTTFVVQNAVLEQHALLSGYVRDINNDPIAGVQITIEDERYTTNTDADGLYSYVFWENHNVSISASKFGYYPQTVNDIELTVGEEVEQDFVLQAIPRITVSGIVNTNDLPAGLEGAKVVLNGAETHTVYTAANGAFSIPDVLGENTYTITITAAGYDGYSGTVNVETTAINLDTITLIEKLWPATNLVASHADGDVELTWDEAAEPEYFFWDFEEDNGGWVGSGYGDWEYGEYNVSQFNYVYTGNNVIPPPAAYSGSKMWGTLLHQNHNNAAAFSYLTRTVNLAGLDNPQIRFRSWENVFGDFDYCQLAVNGNVIWGPSWDYTNTQWQERVVNLSAYTDQEVVLQFQFYATGSVNYAGWYIDDVYIGPPPAREIAGRSRSLQDYLIYRMPLTEQGNPDNWTLLESGFIGTEYTDTGISALSSGMYKWAVVANYSGNHAAPAVLSNTLEIIVAIDTPEDLAIEVDGDNIRISWTPVPGASYYNIYASDDPYGDFEYLGFSAEAFYLTPASPMKKFFRVGAVTGDPIRSNLESN